MDFYFSKLQLSKVMCFVSSRLLVSMVISVHESASYPHAYAVAKFIWLFFCSSATRACSKLLNKFISLIACVPRLNPNSEKAAVSSCNITKHYKNRAVNLSWELIRTVRILTWLYLWYSTKMYWTYFGPLANWFRNSRHMWDDFL